jgi:hypothetical protein
MRLNIITPLLLRPRGRRYKTVIIPQQFRFASPARIFAIHRHNEVNYENL